MTKSETFEGMGGRSILIKINQVFYDKVYQDPWLKKYFEAIPQQHIENQQVDFMQKVLGGENVYVGKNPTITHHHMFIPNELFDLRKKLLQEAFEETNADDELVKKWLMLDESFRRLIINKSPDECKARFKSDPILNFPKPN
ncbi:MAG: group 1 truncated hemoglobin [Colwellia sp.]